MFFHEVLEAQPDPVFGLSEALHADVRPNKVDLIVGIYKDEELRAELMPAVQKAKQRIFPEDLLADYLPIDGFPPFLEEIGKLVFSERRWQDNHSRIYAAQTLGGTGALQVGGQFLAQELTKSVSITTPTWVNHRRVFERAGCKVEAFPYYSREKHGIDFDAMCSFLKKAAEKTVLILHSVCHNPTGCDLSADQWKLVSKIMLERKILPFFDFAYQGLGEGIEMDRKAIEIFLDDGHEMLVAYSCSKNFSLYRERVGALFLVDENSAVKLRVGSHIKKIIRSLYSNPPAHGARIVTTVLQDPILRKEWMQDLDRMRGRIHLIRSLFIKKLSEKPTKIHFDFLRQHKGMFSFMDLDKAQVQRLIDEFAIYLIDNGRISLSGLNHKNIDYVVNGIVAVCQ
jgi:aspartate/tyrosine/aromatic aminotransferase